MTSVELTRPEAQVKQYLLNARTESQALLDMSLDTASDVTFFRERYLAWTNKTIAMLDASYRTNGLLTSSPADEFSRTALSMLDLHIASTTIPRGRLPEVLIDVREKMRVLSSLSERLPFLTNVNEPSERPASSSDGPIFLVHGRDLARREIVRRFLDKATGREIIVLADEPNRGKDLLGKLITSAKAASFAVVILTPDDVGGLVADAEQPRARQNVVFELGLFVGMLGRSRVATLLEPTVELPTDFSGVVYIALSGEGWQIELARELKAAGVEVDLDKVL